MKALVAYYSESGNTEKLAKAIYEGITAVSEKEIGSIAEANPQNYEVIFVGFPVQASGVPAKVEQFIKNIPEGKMLAFFVTHGSLRGGAVGHYSLASCLESGVKTNRYRNFWLSR